MRLFHLLALLIAVIVWAGACRPQFDLQPSAEVVPMPLEPADCPGLDSRLFQLTQTPTPLDLAKEWQLKIKDDKIQVLLILADEDISFLQNFEVEVGTQSGTKLQVFAPVAQLCPLANTSNVLAIQPVAPIFTQ